MQIDRVISTVDTHTAGEPTRIITSGIPYIKGKTMMEKKIWLQNNLDNVRKIAMLEPRGHKDMFGAIITEPLSDDADAGVIFMDSKGYLDMCGHGSIGSVTVLLNSGMIPINDNSDIQKVVIDTPAGKITAHAAIENGVATDVRICNVPAFYYDRVVVNLPLLGDINVDISYGGNFFALVNVKELKMELEVKNIDKLTSIGLQIRKAINELITVIHPISGERCQVPLTEIYQDGCFSTENSSYSKEHFFNKTNTQYHSKNVVVFGNGQIDRSPCGTGTCAKMAYLYEKGKLAIGEPYLHASIIDTVFTGKIIGETLVGDRRAILPEITGRAYITGFHNFIVQKDDPFKEGFVL
ncbi:MAG: proline racemase family protein [Desulfamplus sp.]|nr:proline racemase family protein [Desulfamplus sp.]